MYEAQGRAALAQGAAGRTYTGGVHVDEAQVRRNQLYQERLEYYGHRYGERGSRYDSCVYCGKPSTVWDHIPALAVLEYMVENGVDAHMNPYKVRSCQKCNDTLQDQPIVTVIGRREYLLKRYEELAIDLQERIDHLRRINNWQK